MPKKIEIKKSLLEKYYVNEKLPLSKISEIFETSGVTITKYLKLYNIPTRRGKKIPDCHDLNKLKDMANDPEVSNQDIISEFSITKQTLNLWFEKYNINRHLLRNNQGKKPTKEVLHDLYYNQGLIPRLIGEKYNVSNVTVMNWLKSYKIYCRETSIKNWGTNEPFKSKKLQEKTFSSKGKINLIETLNTNLDINLRPTRLILDGGKELDGYDEKLGIAIEYCDLYWHSEKSGKDRYYHYNKWKQCKDQNIKLFTIFSDEWESISHKIIQYISSNCGIVKNRLPARKTKFGKVDRRVARDFCYQFHIQKNAPTTHAYGLYYNGTLVSVMTFGKHHRDTSKLVMNRFCSLDNWSIQGGASKLMKNAWKEFQEPIITWSDNRWSMGNVYSKIGCKFEEQLPPDYFWTDFTKRINKQSRKKDVTGQPKHLTEKEYNESLGLARIWDCGKIRWLYD